MPTPARTSLATRRSIVPATALRPITGRLTRIQDIVIEVRLVLDLHLKQINLVQRQVAALTEATRRAGAAPRRGNR